MKAIDISDHVLKQRRQLIATVPFLGTTVSGVTFVATSGTVAALDEVGGGVGLTTQAADNAIGSWTTSKIFDATSRRSLYMAVLARVAEAATDKLNVLFGFHSGTVANALGNDGAGPPANYSGFSFFKTDSGSANWSVELSNGTTQVTVELNAMNSLTKRAMPAAGGGADQYLEIDVLPKPIGTKADVVFSINGVAVYKHTDFVVTSLAAMAAVGYVKAGSTTAEVLKTRMLNFGTIR